MSEVFIVLTSKHSPSCKAIQQQINYISPHFNTKVIDIDNIGIRKAIVNATKYKIESVPAIILLYPQNGKIEKHEGQDVINLLNKGVSMVQAKLQAMEEQKKSKAREFDDQNISDGGHSEIEDILGDNEEQDDDDEEAPPQVQRKRKIGKTTLFPDKRFSPTDEDGAIGGMKYLPRKDEHTGMARSSIPDAENRDQLTDRNRNYVSAASPTGKKVNVKNGKKAVIIEDLSEIPDKPEGMSMDDILDSSRTGATARSKETDIKSKGMRERQEALMAERAALQESEEANMKRVRGHL
jgi:hypothetical protein